MAHSACWSLSPAGRFTLTLCTTVFLVTLTSPFPSTQRCHQRLLPCLLFCLLPCLPPPGPLANPYQRPTSPPPLLPQGTLLIFVSQRAQTEELAATLNRTCPFPPGQKAEAIHGDRSQVGSLLSPRYSQLVAPCSLLPAPCSLLLAGWSSLLPPTRHLLLRPAPLARTGGASGDPPRFQARRDTCARGH